LTNLFDAVLPRTEVVAPPPALFVPSSRQTIEQTRQKIEQIRFELRRRYWKTHPEDWASERLNETLWSAQRRIMRSVVDNRKTAVQSCHDIGKSFIASRVVAWWLDTHKPGEAFVVTSAPTSNQVRAILWREIGRAHSRGQLRGRTNQTEWLMMVGDKEELVGFGRKPSDYDPTAFQGIHAPAVLVVWDEACGIPASLVEAGDSLAANNASRVLAIGNPDDPQAEFARMCAPGSGYEVIQVGAFDTPNFTGEQLPQHVKDQLIGELYVEEKRRKWAPGWRWNETRTRVEPPLGADPDDANPVWLSKVLGKFPTKSAEGTLIPYPWIRAAMERDLPPSEPDELGVDVGAGGDSSTIARRRGPVVRVLSEDTNPDTMQTCGKVINTFTMTGSSVVKIDPIGIGKGVLDRGKELGKPFIGVDVGKAAYDTERFANLRAELWWNVRERFERGEIDIDREDDDTAAELASLRYKITSSGKIAIESKLDAKKRGVPSPNRADSIMLAFAHIPEEEGGSVTW
jgi:hypothetical protein